MICDTCGVDKTVTSVKERSFGKRVATWRICPGCERAEKALRDERAQEAIREAERSGI